MNTHNTILPESYLSSFGSRNQRDPYDFDSLIAPPLFYWCAPLLGGWVEEPVRPGYCAILTPPAGQPFLLKTGERSWRGLTGIYRANFIRLYWGPAPMALDLFTQDGASIQVELSVTCAVRNPFRLLELCEPETNFNRTVAHCARVACQSLNHAALCGQDGLATFKEQVLKRLGPQAEKLSLRVEDLYLQNFRPNAERFHLLNEREKTVAEVAVEKERQEFALITAETEAKLAQKKLEVKEVEAGINLNIELQRSRMEVERLREQKLSEALVHALEYVAQYGRQGYESEFEPLVKFLASFADGRHASHSTELASGASNANRSSLPFEEAKELIKIGYETAVYPSSDALTKVIAHRQGLTVEMICQRDYPAAPPKVMFSTNGPESAKVFQIEDWAKNPSLSLVIRKIEAQVSQEAPPTDSASGK